MTALGHPYAGLTASMATKHDKVPLVAPALADGVGMTVVAAVVDTDRLGTFTGEVERPGTPWQTAVAKAMLGLERVGGRLGLASEGSIGPHPAAPVLIAAHELIVLVDRELDIVVGEYESGMDIRTVAAELAPGDPLDSLLQRGDVPRHAVIVRPAQGSPIAVGKGLRQRDEIERWIRVASAVSPDGRAIVETDLRAHECPSRRPMIERAARRLALRVAARCPACRCPGWGVTSVQPGAPCSTCDTPTRLPLAHTWGCPRCEATERLVTSAPAEPANCPWCNP